MDEPKFRAAERALWASVGTDPVERHVTLPHVGTTVRVLEVGDGPPVLFVPGVNNAGPSWASLAAALPDFRCVLLDRPGCGLSDPLRHRLDDLDTLATHADRLIPDVLDALGLDAAPVVATSFGGYFTLRAAATSRRVTRVVLHGWSVGASAPPRSLRIASVPLVGRAMAAAPTSRRSVKAMLRRIGLRSAVDSGRFTAEMLDWYISLLHDTDTLRNELLAGPTFPTVHMDDRLLLPAPLLGQVEAPVLLFWGEDDPFGSAAVARTFTALLPHAELRLVPGAGHAPWIDEPALAAEATREALTAT